MTTFLFIGCTEDELLDTTDKETAENNKYLLTRVDKLDIKSNTFLSNKLMEINQISNFKNTNSIDGDVNFSLNMNEAVYIESLDGLVHSYTFSVNSTNGSNDINNIVLVSHNDQDYKAYLTIYTLTAEEKERFLNGDKIDWIDKAFIEPFNINRIITHGVGGGCVDLFKVDEADCSCHTEHAEGGCTHPKDILEWFEVDCPGGAGGASGGDTGGGNSGNPVGNPGGASGGGSGDSIPTSPINFTPQDPEECPDLEGDLDGNCSIDDFEMFVLNLAPEQADWWHNLASGAQKTEIKAFLLNNNYTQEAKEFVEAVVNAWNENSDAEVDFAYQVIVDKSFKDNPCLMNVYAAMGKAPTFDNYLKNFDSEMSVANLTFSASTSLPDTINAITNPPILNNEIKIEFNLNNLNRPSLDVARTLIHEMIHATMFRWLLESAETGALAPDNGMTDAELINYINNLKDNFPGLYDYYYDRRVPNWSHEQMAAHFIGIIKNALEEFDQTQQDPEVYEALAWVGLKNTISWNNLLESQRDNYNQLRQNFISNNINCQ